ncbi:PucR family transcriptional regulator [Actinoplanes sp. NPDC051343]|uniref:PucR family transcriptional regulator n=1 Tax=Actinoplanes sp. NPDC051343 TaxID=3363906 RepID=UPI003796EE14
MPDTPPPTTLADLVGEPSLDLECAYPAGGLDRPVRWAHSTELLDPSPYLSGGELVCTVGTAVTGDETARRLVGAVAAVGASGICFGTGDVHDSVPEALLAACRAHAMPLLVAPLGRPFMAISEWIADRRADAGTSELRAAERTGELIALVAERLAAPAALEPLATAAGLATGALIFSVWPAGTARRLGPALGTVAALLGDTSAVAFAVTASDAPVRRASADLSLPCGYSRTVPLADSSRALSEARAAFDLARRRPGEAVGPAGLATLEGLLAQQSPDRLAPFVDRLLEPLLRSDRDRRTNYVATLRAFLAANASLIDTARAQYLHVNTVRHRLERVRDLTGSNPLEATGRTDLTIALWANDHLGPTR